MNRRIRGRILRALAIVLAMLALIVLGMLVLPLTEGVDETPVPGSADWMAALPDEAPLSALVIPGTHDSATQHVQLAYFSRCQALSIGQQLEAGFRYLDIRLGDADKTEYPRLMHGFTECRRAALGPTLTLDAVLADCYAFLTRHPTETVLFAVKHEHGDAPDSAMAAALDGFIQARPQAWLLTDRVPTLGEARGKLVLLRRWEGGDGLPLLWEDQRGAEDVSLNAVRAGQEGLRFWVQDRFEYDTQDKWEAFTAGLQAPAAEDEILLSFLSTKGSSTYGHPYQFAEKLNDLLLRQPPAKLRGWIVVDYASPKLAAHIYTANTPAEG